jgi:sec-independent protein translocase protein TatB
MEIFGIGISELIFVVIIALIVLGPKDMEKTGRTIGKWMRSVITSDSWRIFQQTSREIRTLPTKLMREANEELGKVRQDINTDLASSSDAERIHAANSSSRSQPYSPTPSPAAPSENKIAPQTTEQKESESGQ